MKPGERGRSAGAKAARSAGIRTRLAKRRDGPTLCGGRASRAFNVVCSPFLFLKRLFSDARFHLKCATIP